MAGGRTLDRFLYRNGEVISVYETVADLPAASNAEVSRRRESARQWVRAVVSVSAHSRFLGEAGVSVMASILSVSY